MAVVTTALLDGCRDNCCAVLFCRYYRVMVSQSNGINSSSSSSVNQELEAARAALAFKAVAVCWREQESEIMRLCVTQEVCLARPRGGGTVPCTSLCDLPTALTGSRRRHGGAVTILVQACDWELHAYMAACSCADNMCCLHALRLSSKIEVIFCQD